MRRDVQLFLGKKKLNKASKGENIVSNPLISDDTDYSLVNHSAVVDGKARLTTITGSEASIGQTISGLLPNKRYQLRLVGLDYPTENLVVNRAFRSQEFDRSIWNKVRCTIGANTTAAPDGETTADSIFNSSPNNLIFQSRDFTSGEPVTISTYVKRGAATTISLFVYKDIVVFNLTSNTVTSSGSRMSNSSIEEANNGWYRISCTYTPTASLVNKDFGIKNISAYQFLYIWGFQMEEGDSLGLYVKNVSKSDSSYKYVNQTQQQISNYLNYSRVLSNGAWSKVNTTATDGQLSYFGDFNGTKLQGTVSLNSNYTFQNVSITNQTSNYVVSYYAKRGDSNYISSRVNETTPSGSKFTQMTVNLNTGAITNLSGASTVNFTNVEYMDNGWYKISVGIATSLTSVIQVLFSSKYDDVNWISADTTAGLPITYISNIQLEENLEQGQYIAATASSIALGKPNNTLVISDTSDGSGGLQYYTDLQAGSRSLVVDFNTGNTTGDLKIEIQDNTTTAQIEIEALSIKEIIEPFYSTEQYSVDMFDFEDLNVVDKIKDVRDISKVFTEYTQKFTVPASANNNQLFDHFYNENVVSGFDHRLKHEAVIKIGGADYKHGQLTLLSSSLKNGQPYSYSLVFYGNTVKLKDLISDDKLSDLTGTVLDNLNLEYNSTNIFNLLTHGMNFDDTDTLVANTDNGQNDPTPDVFVPFISCDSHYFYDALDEAQVKDRVSSRNVRYDSAQSTRGIYYKDLKLAVKVKYVIRAIEEKYGLKFSNDFFNENIKAYNELSLFLHKESGGISKQLETTTDTVALGDLTKTNTYQDFRGFGRHGQNTSGWNNDYLDMYAEKGFNFTGGSRKFYSYRINFDITPVGSGEYTVELIDASSGSDGSSDFSFTGTGAQTFGHIFKSGTENGFDASYKYQYVKPRFRVSTQSGITQYTIDNIQIQRVSTYVYQLEGITINSSGWEYEAGFPTYEYSSGGSTLTDISGGVSFQSQMPNMKVLDFLTSIFKMFNLTAYFVPETDVSPFAGQIRVRTLDAYYLSGKEVDISPYVDTASSVISRNKLYSTVEFEYPNHMTLASIKQGERTGDVFGSEVMNNLESNLDNPLAFDGGKYKVKSNFEKVMYERMTDQSDSTTILPIQWGWMASKDENPVLGKALLFYPIYEDVNAVYDGEGETFELDFDTSIYDKNKNVITSSHTNFSNYIRPSNSLRGNSSSLNFGSEYDEWYVWEGSGTNENSLFNRYYKNYLLSIYNIQSRLVTVDTHLPVNILMKLKLEDIVIINRKQFRINSLKLNITTGKAKLELMNDIAYSQLFIAPVSISTDWRTNVPTLGWTSQITIEDDSSNDATSYRLYSNGVFLREFSSKTVIVTNSQLTSGLNEITVTKVTNYDNSFAKESAYSNIIEITV